MNTKNLPGREVRGRILACLLLASGFCGISYEVLYGRLLADLIGSQFIVNAAILLTFLVGIGWGTLYAHRLWRYLYMVEAGIGLYAFAFANGTGVIDSLLYTVDFNTGNFSYLLLFCVGLLIIPAFLIGISLPVMAGYMSRLRTGPVFGKSYAVYNFGAAIVVLLIEYYFIRIAGIRLATSGIACLNGVVAAVLFFYYADIRQAVPESDEAKICQPMSHKTALVFVSIGSAVFQLLMIKVAECLFGPFRETFALVLSMVLGGIAVGSWLVQRLRLSFNSLLLINLGGLLWLIGGFSLMVEGYAALHDSHLPLLVVKILLLFAMMAIPSMSFGATIPALLVRPKDVARESGELLFLSSMANGVGFLLMVFVLHQRFDYGVLFLWVAFFTLASFFVYKRPGIRQWCAAVVIVISFFSVFRARWNEDLLYLGHTAFDSRQTMTETQGRFTFPEKFKGPQDIFSIVWARGRPRFFINGYISMALDSLYEPLVGALSSVYAPRLDNALVLGVGSGNTASVAGLLFEHTDGVEINGTVLANLQRMKKYNMDIEHNPKVSLVQDDAIHFIKAGTSQYSLIINTVTTPLYFSSAKLYTVDFLDQVKKRLTRDGVYMTWVDSRVGEQGIDIMLRTIGKTFKHCGLAYIKSSYFLLLCSDTELHAQHPMAVAEHPVLGPRFRKEFQIEPQWIAYGLLHPDALRLLGDDNALINRLDYPALEFSMSRLRDRGYSKFKKRLRDEMSQAAIKQVVSPEMHFDPSALLMYAQMVLGDDSSITKRWRRLVEDGPSFKNRYAKLLAKKTMEFAALSGTADSFHKAGYRLMEEELYPQAIIAFKQALIVDPKRNNSYFNIGACYEYMEQYQLALENYRAEWGVDPEDEDVTYRLGRVLVKEGNYNQGRIFLKRAANQSPTARIYYYLALANEGLDEREMARAAFQEAMRLDSDDKQILDAWKTFQEKS